MKMNLRPRTLDRILFYAVVLFLLMGMISGSVISKEMDCDIQNTSCTKSLSGFLVTLDIHPKPVTAMTDLVFTVIIKGEIEGNPPYIDLGMPGMDMGPNRVHLKEVAEGKYEGTGIIVRCKSGRRTWKATITIPEKGNVTFQFDVIY